MNTMYYTCYSTPNICVEYTPVLHVWNMCIRGVLHIYYKSMNYIYNTP